VAPLLDFVLPARISKGQNNTQCAPARRDMHHPVLQSRPMFEPEDCLRRADPSSMLSTLASLELKANHELHNTRVAGAAHRSESIDIIYGPVRILIQVCDRWIAKAFEINRAVDAVKLRVIEHVEGVCAQLKLSTFADKKGLLDR